MLEQLYNEVSFYLSISYNYISTLLGWWTIHKFLGRKNWIMIPYKYGGKKYYMPLKIRRGPPRIHFITDSCGVDVTEEITPYLGVNQDFHEITDITPLELGYSQLIFYYNNGNIKIFNTKSEIFLD